jgi:hypothetical protein
LTTLRKRELDAVGTAIQQQSGLQYRSVRDGESASGIYRRSVQLVSGKFAVIEDGTGFSLVPWKPLIEHHIGQHLSAVVRGSSATWHYARQRGLSP